MATHHEPLVSRSTQISLIGLRSSKDYFKRPSGVVGVYRKGHLGVSFFKLGQCVQKEQVLGGDGLYGYFREQELPAGAQEHLEGFHRRSVDYR